MVTFSGWQPPLETAQPVLLFIHGLGCDSSHYQAAFSSAELQSFTLWIPDLPGYGCQAQQEQVKPLEAIAEELQQMVQQLSVPVIVVGHSMGGAIALLMLRQVVPTIAGFINVEGNLIGADCTFSRKAAAVPYPRFVTERLPALLRAYQNHPYGASVERSDPATFYQHSLDLVRLSDTEELLQQFLNLSIPRVYIYGSHNREHPVLPRLTGIPKIEISQSGHFPMLDNPTEFYRAVAMAAGSMLSPR